MAKLTDVISAMAAKNMEIYRTTNDAITHISQAEKKDYGLLTIAINKAHAQTLMARDGEIAVICFTLRYADYQAVSDELDGKAS